MAVKVQPKTVICCYYRPHIHLQNANIINEFLDYLQRKCPAHTTIFVGDMNLPGIDWKKGAIKPTTIHRKMHQNFIDVQLVTDSTHVLGNTLNLICTNQPNIMLCDAEIIISGFSDHSVIVAHLRNSTTSPPQPTPHNQALQKS